MTDDTKSPTPAIPEAAVEAAWKGYEAKQKDVMALSNDKMRAALVAALPYLATPTPADNGSGVRVKTLEWESHPARRPNDLFAESLLGDYSIRPATGGARLFMPGEGYNDAPLFATLDEAKAAAQAHHDTAIRSALVPATSDDVRLLGAEAMKRAAKAAFVASFFPSGRDDDKEYTERMWLLENHLMWDRIAEAAVRTYGRVPATSVPEPSEVSEPTDHVMDFDGFEAWLHAQHREVGITPALQKAWDDYKAAVGDEAFASRTPPVHPAPKRWLVEEHLSSGSIRWRAYEHELQARSEAAMCAAPATVTPLYVHPAPVGETPSEKDRYQAAWSVWKKLADHGYLSAGAADTGRQGYQVSVIEIIKAAIPVPPAPVGERDKALEEVAQLVEGFTRIRPAFTTEDAGTKWENPAQQEPIYSPWKLVAAIRALKTQRED